MVIVLFSFLSVLSTPRFSSSQFFVSFCLLIFSILYASRQQLRIVWPYWLVFLPLFIWKALAILGALIGIITYCCVRPRK